MTLYCHGHEYAGPTHKHHITPKANGGSDEKGNLVSLCPNCHTVQHTTMYMVANAGAFELADWLKFCHGQGRFICYGQIKEHLRRTGYRPYPDSWSYDPLADIAGSCPFPAVYSDRFMELASGNEFKVLSIIARWTFAWQYNNSPIAISSSFFQMSKPAATKAIAGLEKYNILHPIVTGDISRRLYFISADPGAIDWRGLVARKEIKDAQGLKRIQPALKKDNKS